MQKYEYVTRAEYSPVKNEIESVIKRAQIIMEEKYETTFYFELIGSGRRHLITRIKGGNKGYDFDYNLIIEPPEQGYKYLPDVVNKDFINAFNKAVKGTRFNCPEDSTSALTFACIDRKNKKRTYGCDLAIIYYASDDPDDGYYYLKNWKNGKYSFELRKPSQNIDWKLNIIREYENGWNWIRDEYLKLKNKNKDKNKKSFVLYLESIHNVYNWIQQWEDDED